MCSTLIGSNAQPLGRKAPPLIAVVAVWSFITAAIIAITAAGQWIKTSKLDWVDRTIWEIGWLGWVPLTYVVLALCRKYPIDRQHRLSTVARLAVYGLGIVVVQMGVDFICNSTLGFLLRSTAPSWRFLLYIVVFKAHLFYGVYWMIVGAAHAYEYHARYLRSQVVSSQLEAKLASAELNLLKVQLQPHFLFNTHNAIISLMLKQDNPAAIRMLTRLSDLLRVSLSHSRDQLVTVDEEIATLRLYLDIQQERFRDRLSVDIDVPTDLHSAELPHLILQPLVENALTHGLEDVTEDGYLRVTVRRADESLVLTVEDNGDGFSCDPAADRSVSLGVGVGLNNTCERLQQLYGSKQALQIRSQPGDGCMVTISIPYTTSKTGSRVRA